MMRLSAESGIVLSIALMGLLAVLTVINLWVGNYLVATFNIACFGASLYLLARWIEIRRNRRRLEI